MGTNIQEQKTQKSVNKIYKNLRTKITKIQEQNKNLGTKYRNKNYTNSGTKVKKNI
jgi:predicted mannosyl-3-phosphoglycerate phosphatase (HAD superfamily)